MNYFGRYIIQPILIGSWYLSVLLISGYLIWGMLSCFKEKTINFLFSILIIFSILLLFEGSDSIENWTIHYGISFPILRGLFEMCFGVLIYNAIKSHSNELNNYSVLINVIAIISLVLYLLLMFTNNNYDIYIILFIPLLLFGCYINGSWINQFARSCPFIKGISSFGKSSLYIYLIHPPVLKVCNYVLTHLQFESRILIIIIDLSMVVICSLCLKLICEKLIIIRTRE